MKKKICKLNLTAFDQGVANSHPQLQRSAVLQATMSRASAM